ncbi:hypothetical protein [Pseudoduganella sp. OTU4001]|uniref:hypothetical protein n=1 Tax=Pseudoduganella sp. OTU4001 TaxID=3043854 RepID=UPI00313CC338
MKSFLMGLALLAGALAGPAAAVDEVAGMVLDVQGNSNVQREGARSKVQLLDYLTAPTRLVLEADARVSLSHYKARRLYRLTGPAQVLVGADQVQVLQGPPASSQALAEPARQGTPGSGATPAAVKMRGLGPEVRLGSPAANGVVLDLRPEFQWEAVEPSSYQVSVVELPQRVVASGSSERRGWQLPAGVALEPGKDYRWIVSYRSAADGMLRTASAEFRVASADESGSMQRLRPAPGAAVDEWVWYATILREHQMYDEARRAWQAIAARRPDLADAHSLAR